MDCELCTLIHGKSSLLWASHFYEKPPANKYHQRPSGTAYLSLTPPTQTKSNPAIMTWKAAPMTQEAAQVRLNGFFKELKDSKGLIRFLFLVRWESHQTPHNASKTMASTWKRVQEEVSGSESRICDVFRQFCRSMLGEKMANDLVGWVDTDSQYSTTMCKAELGRARLSSWSAYAGVLANPTANFKAWKSNSLRIDS